MSGVGDLKQSQYRVFPLQRLSFILSQQCYAPAASSPLASRGIFLISCSPSPGPCSHWLNKITCPSQSQWPALLMPRAPSPWQFLERDYLSTSCGQVFACLAHEAVGTFWSHPHDGVPAFLVPAASVSRRCYVGWMKTKRGGEGREERPTESPPLSSAPSPGCNSSVQPGVRGQEPGSTDPA